MRKLKLAVMIFILSLTLIPATVFAGTGAIWPNAEFTITDKDGKPVVLEYDYLLKKFTNFPKNGDVVRIYKDGNTSASADETYVYNGKTFDTEKGDFRLRYEITDSDYTKSTANLRIYRREDSWFVDSDLQFDINKARTVTRVRAPLKSFTFTPSKIRLDSEKIKIKSATGETMYKFSKRMNKAPNGSWMESECALGDKITVTFENGTVKTYDSILTAIGGSYVIRFTDGQNEPICVYALNEDMQLYKGNNKVRMYIPPNKDITTTIDVFVWTPDMGEFPGDYAEEPSQAEPEETPSTPSDPPKSNENTSRPNNPPKSDTNNTTVKPDTTNKESKVEPKKDETINTATVKRLPAVKSLKLKRSGRKVKISWKKLSSDERQDVDRIQLQYSRSRKFVKGKTKTVYVSKNKASYTIKKFNSATCYVRVRTIQTNKTSAWSAVKKITLKTVRKSKSSTFDNWMEKWAG